MGMPEGLECWRQHKIKIKNLLGKKKVPETLGGSLEGLRLKLEGFGPGQFWEEAIQKIENLERVTLCNMLKLAKNVSD